MCMLNIMNSGTYEYSNYKTHKDNGPSTHNDPAFLSDTKSHGRWIHALVNFILVWPTSVTPAAGGLSV